MFRLTPPDSQAKKIPRQREASSSITAINHLAALLVAACQRVFVVTSIFTAYVMLIDKGKSLSSEMFLMQSAPQAHPAMSNVASFANSPARPSNRVSPYKGHPSPRKMLIEI
ncbi:hypothetical protein JTE90_016713 [Oedothorax gibbosus]|uniref:Uncharacterized protein n=1 Tax=Oedothorax gibbosus TaxID=931172 RepID=A0AAV6V3R1_9ARAC|nr:hypothetical protein JTE90_016713 [Oedothorax gibbosus]